VHDQDLVAVFVASSDQRALSHPSTRHVLVDEVPRTVPTSSTNST
jgi:hypothetical protein